MNLLLLHQNFPGQFRQLAPALRAGGHQVVGIGARRHPWAQTGARYLSCGGDPQADLRQSNPEMRLTAQLAHGRRVLKQLLRLKMEGWRPDLILVHPFWGDALFLDDAFPDVPLVALMELDFQGLNLDRFDPEFGQHAIADLGANLALRQWADQMAQRRMVQGLTATHFQRSSYPAWQQSRIAVIHEGVDLQRCCPNPTATLPLANGLVLRRGDPVISFVSRGLEPLRGLPTFLRCLPPLLAGHPSLQVVIVGKDEPCYGPPPPREQRSWRSMLMGELGGSVDWNRIHFTGHLPYRQLLSLFQITQAHVYLTYPYVLSWSMLEAMACGAVVVGSTTPPVEEVIQHGFNGWLVPFFEPNALANQLLQVLRQPQDQERIRMAARRTVVQRYDYKQCVQEQISMLTRVNAAHSL